MAKKPKPKSSDHVAALVDDIKRELDRPLPPLAVFRLVIVADMKGPLEMDDVRDMIEHVDGYGDVQIAALSSVPDVAYMTGAFHARHD